MNFRQQIIMLFSIFIQLAFWCLFWYGISKSGKRPSQSTILMCYLIFAFCLFTGTYVMKGEIENMDNDDINFVCNKIVAPIFVGLFLGFAGYLFSGTWSVGGGFALIGSVITIAVSGNQ